MRGHIHEIVLALSSTEKGLTKDPAPGRAFAFLEVGSEFRAPCFALRSLLPLIAILTRRCGDK